VKESAQLEAIKAELVADGYQVEFNVEGSRLAEEGVDGLKGVTLDIVARLPAAKSKRLNLPQIWVVEIANRERRKTVSSGRRPLGRRQLDDEEAVARFEKISAALASYPKIGFQIRFLDVSADQAAARQLTSTKVRDKSAMAALVERDRLLLSSLNNRPLPLQLAVTTRLWAHWLRIIAHINPGTARTELQYADLRTLQKDLFDEGILEMSPASYGLVHLQMMAIVEGGDVEPKTLLDVQTELQKLLLWSAKHYGVTVPDLRAPEPSSVFARVWKELRERAPEGQLQAIERELVALRTFEGSDGFARQLARLYLLIGSDRLVSQDLLDELFGIASDLEGS
jgi:hypothetical protein